MNLTLRNKIFIIACWLLLALMYGIQNYVFYAIQGIYCNFFLILADHTPNFFLWGFYTLLIFNLLERLESRNWKTWKQLVFFHLPFALALGIFHVSFLTVFRLLYTSDFSSAGIVELWKRYSFNWLYFQLVSYAAIAAIYYSTTSARKIKAQEKEKLILSRQVSDARLNALKMQLHPHFFFNTLNTVSMLIRNNQNAKANNVVAGLGDLLRHMLDRRDLQLVPLRQEVDLLAKYLSIEEIRFDDRLVYFFDIEEDAFDELIPDMLLQPLVENSIKHGLNGKTGKASIFVKARVEEGMLKIEVTDNGTGMRDQARENGVGLTNLRERLSTIYGPIAKLEFQNTERGGLRVSISLPQIPKAELI